MLRLIKVDSRIFKSKFSQSKDKIDDMLKLSNVRANDVQIRSHEVIHDQLDTIFQKARSRIPDRGRWRENERKRESQKFEAAFSTD